MTKKDAQSKGRRGERIAADYLVRQGYTILGMNIRVSHKEIDILASDDEYLIFVEVKSGRLGEFGHPLEWVNARKKKLLVEAAATYMMDHQPDKAIRFDVIAICREGGEDTIQHIKGAFTADSPRQV